MWFKATVAEMGQHFRAGSVTEAVVAGVGRIGATLAAHFPLAQGPGAPAHPNELPDDPT
jgi:uncharacterized membrane protein